MGVLTYFGAANWNDSGKFQSSTSRHGGTDFCTKEMYYVYDGKFQSSTSRHGGTDKLSTKLGRTQRRSFNPLHRGMGVLT